MPSRPKQNPKEPQKHPDNVAAEGGEKSLPNRNKRDREGASVQNPVAVSPEAKKGTIVSYMSDNTLPTTPRRGEI